MTDKVEKPWLFQPGESGNPAGRPKGSRNRVSEDFLNDLYVCWNETVTDEEGNSCKAGKQAIRWILQNDPSKAIACMTQVLPKDFQVTVSDESAQFVINAKPELTTQQWLEQHSIGKKVEVED